MSATQGVRTMVIPEMKALIGEMKERVDEYKTGELEKLVGLPDSELNQFYEK